MNLLSLIIIFLALLVCGSIAYIAWDLTADDKAADRERDDPRQPSDAPDEP